MTNSTTCWVKATMSCALTWRTLKTRHVTSSTAVLASGTRRPSTRCRYPDIRGMLVRKRLPDTHMKTSTMMIIIKIENTSLWRFRLLDMYVYFFFQIDFVDDCFTQTIHNVNFSTKDQDNDASDVQCANTYFSGWWHNSCHCANPNGLYLAGPNSRYGRGMTYSPWHTQYYSLKSTKLMVRRNVQQNTKAWLQDHEPVEVEVPLNLD